MSENYHETASAWALCGTCAAALAAVKLIWIDGLSWWAVGAPIWLPAVYVGLYIAIGNGLNACLKRRK